VKIVAYGGFTPEKIPRFEKLCVPADISTMSSYLFNNNGATVINDTADVVRVKVHGHWVGMTLVCRALCENPDLERAW